MDSQERWSGCSSGSSSRAGGGGGSGWETHKENIQPLSGGRKVAVLEQSLLLDTSKSMRDYELEMEQHIKNHEDAIAEYKGDDPLEPWIEFISFLEQSNLMVAKLKKKLKESVRNCIKTFSGESKYRNDRRFVSLYIKLSQELEMNRRCAALKTFLFDKGIGPTVAEMYIEISNLEESEGKNDEALKTLRLGIERNAQPIEKLQDALEGLQYRISQKLAEGLNRENNDDIDDSVEVARHFGASVPVFGPKSEAPVFRNELAPAEPVSRFKPPLLVRIGGAVAANVPCKPISVQDDSTELKVDPNFGASLESVVDSSQPSIGVCRSTLSDICCKAPEDKENKLDPTTWNNEDVVIPKQEFVVPAIIDTPVEKFKLFGDDDTAPKGQSSLSQVKTRSVAFSSSTTSLPKSAPPVSTVYNGSSSGPVSTVNVVSLKMCAAYGQIEMRRRQLWRENEAIRLKSIKTEQLELERNTLKVKCTRLEVELREITSQLSEALNSRSVAQSKLIAHERELTEYKKSVEFELQKLRESCEELKIANQKIKTRYEEVKATNEQLMTANEELKATNVELMQDLKSQDEKVREQHVLISSERYQSQQLSDELEEKNKLIADLKTRLEEEMKKASSSNSSGPSSGTSTLVATTGSVSSCSAENGATGDGVNNNSNTSLHASNDEFSFLPNPTSSASHQRGIETEKQQRYLPITSSADTFDASVRMGTTYFMKEDSHAAMPVNNARGVANKCPLKQVHNLDLDDVSSFLPPPPMPKKALNFNLYESMNESLSSSLFAPMSISSAAPKPTMGPPPSMQNNTAKENVPPSISATSFVSRHGGKTMGMGSMDIDISVIGMDDDDDEPHAGNDRTSNFDLADLTRNLQLNQPLLNSTPERFAPANCAMNLNEQRGNFIHTQRFKPISLDLVNSEFEGPMSPHVLAREKRSMREAEEAAATDENAENDMSMLPVSLSPIQETSKENRSSCTTGSSSSNMTSTRGGSTASGTSLYNSTRSVSSTKSASKHYA